MGKDTSVYQIRNNDVVARPTGACYAIASRMGDNAVTAAFVEDKNQILESHKEFDDLLATSKKYDDLYFVGVLSDIKEGSIYLINCPCVIKNYREHKFDNTDTIRNWIEHNTTLHPCGNHRCSSMCCSRCFKRADKDSSGRYRCPFPCKKGNLLYCTFNDEKKKQKKMSKISSDQNKCDMCGIDQEEFHKKKPMCKPISWTKVPNQPQPSEGELEKVWCNACRVKMRGYGRISNVNTKRSLQFNLGFGRITQEQFDAEIEKLNKVEMEKELQRASKEPVERKKKRRNEGSQEETKQSRPKKKKKAPSIIEEEDESLPMEEPPEEAETIVAESIEDPETSEGSSSSGDDSDEEEHVKDPKNK